MTPGADSAKRGKEGRRGFTFLEIVFDALYLCAALTIGISVLANARLPVQTLTGILALTLAIGDLFHLVPRMVAAATGTQRSLRHALGLGKQITSVTMTAFYVLLWQIGLLLFSPAPAAGWTLLVWLLAGVRVVLCCFPQNGWYEETPPLNWAVCRNLPFFLLGFAVAVLFGIHAQEIPSLRWMWLAIALSFAFYLPVVFWSGRYRMLGMLMLPKTCVYVWMLLMCASI